MAEATGIKEIIKPENLVYKRTKIMTDNILSLLSGLWSWNSSPDSCRNN